mmetsp:Transcript_100649/g.290766  ORF Transcript_100649/g.290766 Transcript_100649/m.290766 type:complete len:459 (+) Transcript_100649:506-1882(+)
MGRRPRRRLHLVVELLGAPWSVPWGGDRRLWLRVRDDTQGPLENCDGLVVPRLPTGNSQSTGESLNRSIGAHILVAGGLVRRTSLIDVQAKYGPIRLCEALRAPIDEFLARHLVGDLGAALREGWGTQVSAEGDVEDQAHILEVILVATIVRQPEVRIGPAPTVRVRLAGRYVGRDPSSSRPEPRAKMAVDGIPLRRKGTASALVERRAEGAVGPRLGAALVAPLALRANITIVREPVQALHPLPAEMLACVHVGLGTTGCGVQRGHGPVRSVGAFDDVELAPSWPNVLGVLAIHPKGGPNATTRWHVLQIDNKQAAIVGSPRHDAYGGPALEASLARMRVNNSRRIGAHHHLSPARADQPVLHRGLIAREVDRAVSRILRCMEAPMKRLEEVLAHVTLTSRVDRGRPCRQRSCGEGEGKHSPRFHREQRDPTTCSGTYRRLASVQPATARLVQAVWR